MSSLTDQQYRAIEQQFRAMDLNGDGQITARELRQALSAAGQDFSRKAIHKLIKEADSDGDGKIIWSEFLELMQKTMLPMEESVSVSRVEASGVEYDQAIKAFRIFDHDNSGRISRSEMRNALKELKIETDDAKIEDMFLDLDKDGDGTIDYTEFAILLGI